MKSTLYRNKRQTDSVTDTVLREKLHTGGRKWETSLSSKFKISVEVFIPVTDLQPRWISQIPFATEILYHSH